MTLRVAVVGASGRLGRFACELLGATNGFDVVGRLGSRDDLEANVKLCRPDIALEVTRAGLGYEHGLRLIELGVRPLVGTSGISLEQNAALDAAARERGIGGLVVPNFSLGMVLMQRAAVEAARLYAAAEIIEMHHEDKRDAPSGTARDTAERMRAARGGGAEIPVHSVRLPGLYAHQLVLFGGPGEVYTLRHDMHGPEGFARGIVRGLEYAATAVGVGRGIALAFESGV